MTKLEKYLFQIRRIEEHREKTAEKEIRKIYKEVLKELNSFLADIYVTYSEDDMLTYANLAAAGMDARFLEEVEQHISGISPKISREIQDTVERTYEACYDGMRNAVVKAAGDRELLQQAFATVRACTPDMIRVAVNNPISGLTLKDRLEKHRKDIIYDIKQNIGVGLSNGDRYSTMARRISESLDGDYKKAVRIVRTEAHRARETGNSDAATAINEALLKGTSGYVMAKTWRTMKDERVRPNRVYKTKKGWKQGKKGKYDHVKMDGVTIPQTELFVLPSGAKCMSPSQTGVAGEDINCRCYCSYDLVKASELTKVQSGEKTIEEAAQVEEAVVDNNESVAGLTKPIRNKRASAYDTEEEYEAARDNYRKARDEYNSKIDEVVQYNLSKDRKLKTFEDVQEWADKNGLVLKESVKYNVDIRALEDYADTTAALIKKYPIVKNDIAKYEYWIDTTNDALAEANGGFRFGRAFSDYENVLRGYYESITDGDMVRGDGTIKGLYRHEFGHYLDLSISGAFGDDTMKRARYKEDLRNTVYGKDGMSEYATFNDAELFAEAFAEYESGADTEFAKAFGEFLKRWL